MVTRDPDPEGRLLARCSLARAPWKCIVLIVLWINSLTLGRKAGNLMYRRLYNVSNRLDGSVSGQAIAGTNALQTFRMCGSSQVSITSLCMHFQLLSGHLEAKNTIA